jgi:hypothetical protein
VKAWEQNQSTLPSQIPKETPPLLSALLQSCWNKGKISQKQTHKKLKPNKFHKKVVFCFITVVGIKIKYVNKKNKKISKNKYNNINIQNRKYN